MRLHWSFKTKLMLVAIILGFIVSIHVCLQPRPAPHLSIGDAWAILRAAGYLL